MTNHKKIIQTAQAPEAIGVYSQAVVAGNTVYLSGQIPLVPETMDIVEGEIQAQIRQVFRNLAAVCEVAGGSLDHIVKLNVYLTDLKHFQDVNLVMSELFSKPYPARAAIEVSALPRGVAVEVDGVMVLATI
jgi:reactive intermediate/imine deaminase